jgi:hypothetical protein
MCLPDAKELHARAGQPNSNGTLFAEDPQRGERMAVQTVGLFLDYSKNRVTDETLKLIVPELKNREEPALGHDTSANNLIRRYRKLKEAS